MEIWLNPACQKCRTAVATLDEAGLTYTVRRYLDDVPSADEIAEVLDRLGLEPWDIARTKEAKEAGIALPKTPQARREWLEALAAHPRAIQRPIITATDGSAVVGRDPEALETIIRAEQRS